MSVYLREVPPITKTEFSRMLQKCKPPVGWPKTIAVANSGGPDSTCLLFLLHQHFNLRDDSARSENLEQDTFLNPASTTFKSTGTRDLALGRHGSLVSITVDHALQASSADMAAQSGKLAARLGIEHVTSKIPWGQVSFPPKPGPGTSFEAVARFARYALLFEAMRKVGTDTLAVGHHADDQVDTALHRLGMGSSLLGAAGMRPCRRWGMGLKKEGDLSWYGLGGMRTWMIRPFLDVGKDRILATCEQHGLEYVTDKTNFQPEVTIKNALRYIIRHGKTNIKSLPLDIQTQVDHVESALARTPELDVDLASGLERLRKAVAKLSSDRDEVEAQVDRILDKCRLPSPPGTFLLSQGVAMSLTEQYLVQRALVQRILRYVSPEPWGSVQAQASLNNSSIERIITKIWTPINAKTSAFVAGSGVLWKPVVYRRGLIKNVSCVQDSPADNNDLVAWLIRRQPPYKKNTALDNFPHKNLQEKDITSVLLDALNSWRTAGGSDFLETMFDNRFILQFTLSKIPEDLVERLVNHGSRIIIQPATSWYLPYVVRKDAGGAGDKPPEVIHAKISPVQESLSSTFSGEWQTQQDCVSSSVDWIKTEFVRVLSSI